MIEMVALFALGLTLYAMKAGPFYLGRLPQNRFAITLFDLLPVGLLTALLLSPVIVGAVDQPMLEGILVVAAVVVAIALTVFSGKAAIGILAGLVVLAAAELI